MDVHSAGPNPEPHDSVPEDALSIEQLLEHLLQDSEALQAPDLDVSCSWCKIESGGQYDEASKQILCGSCKQQWPLIFGTSQDPKS